jgi:hypothetical protein
LTLFVGAELLPIGKYIYLPNLGYANVRVDHNSPSCCPTGTELARGRVSPQLPLVDLCDTCLLLAPATISPVTGVMQLMRHCRKPLLLHMIPSPSGFFVAGLEGWGSPRRKIPEAAVHVSAILEPEGDSERRLQSTSFEFVDFHGEALLLLVLERRENAMFLLLRNQEFGRCGSGYPQHSISATFYVPP